MKQIRISLVFSVSMLTCILVGAQVELSTTFILPGNPSVPAVVDDSTSVVTVTFQADQLNENFFPTAIDSGFILVDAQRYLYRVDSVLSANISTAQIRVIALNPATGHPLGGPRGLVYEPIAANPYLIPPAPENDQGTPPNFNSHLHNNNLTRIGQIAATGGDFDWDRPIARVWYPGLTIGGDQVVDGLEWMFFTVPAITLTGSPATTVFEVGDSTQIIYSGATSNPSGATLSNGELNQTSPLSITLLSFGAATSYADTIQFAPQQGGASDYEKLSYTFQASQDWVSGMESGTANSPSRSLSAYYPVLYGMSASDSLTTPSPVDPYTTLTLLVEAEGDKAVTYTGTGYIYFMIPTEIPGGWSDTDLADILDPNGFSVIPSFKTYTFSVSSAGKTNDWTVNYKVYQLETTTSTSSETYTFIQN